MAEPSQLYKAATESVALADLSHHARWLVKGADAIRFIHGQCTNDVNRLSVGEGCYACFLTIKGKLRGDAVIYGLGDALGIVTEPELSEPLRASLEKFIIADDVQIEDVTQTTRHFLIMGPHALDFIPRQLGYLESKPNKLYECAFQQGDWLSDYSFALTYRANVPSYEIFTNPDDGGNIWHILTKAAPTLDAPTLELLRIEAGIPKFGVDMDENTIPIEAGLESRALSYTKGCYIGQEVISRIHSLGHVNRHLAKIRVPGLLPNRGDKIQVDGKDIGQVTSAVFSPRYGSGLALGYVRREHAKAGTKVSINNQSAEVIELCGSGASV